MKHKLHDAKALKYDEYYTTAEDIEKQLQEIAEITTFNWMCPCDGENSNFVKVAKEKGIRVRNEHEQDILLQNLNIKENEIIFTNPPFHNLTEILKKLEKSNCKFCIVIPQTALGYQIVLKNIKRGKWFLNGRLREFETPGGRKQVMCVWLNNFKQITNYYEFSTNEPAQLTQDGKYYNADKLKDISLITAKPQAVPITYLYYHNSDLFNIIGFNDNIIVKGKRKFKRIIIIKKENNNGNI